MKEGAIRISSSGGPVRQGVSATPDQIKKGKQTHLTQRMVEKGGRSMDKKISGVFSLFLGFGLVSLLFVPFAQAAPVDYPTRPIEVVIATSPGGSSDIGGRLVNAKLSEILGVTLLNINKPAGGGIAGVESVVRAKPDGYTILSWSDISVVLLPLLNPQITFTHRDLVPIGRVAEGPVIIVVPSSSPFKTLQEALDFAKKNPGKLTFGSTGTTHTSRLILEVIRKSAGVDMAHVPYQGGGPLTPAILAGQVDIACTAFAAVVSLVKAGNVRALAICSAKRSEELPQVPTVGELGFPNAGMSGNVGLMAPLGTPQPIIDKWHQAIQKAVADPKFTSQLSKAAFIVDYRPPEEMAKSMENMHRILSEVLTEVGLIKK